MDRKFKKYWSKFWMRFAGSKGFGKFSNRLAALTAPPHKAARSVAFMNPRGFISPSAKIYRAGCHLGKNVFLGDRVIIFQATDKGAVTLGNRVTILRDSIIETGEGGCVIIGDDTYIHPRCQLNAYINDIQIGKGVLIAANCAFYTHNHGIAPNQPIIKQPLNSKGPIIIGDNSWLGTGVIVLGGVHIGEGAVIGAGAVVTEDIVPNGIAVGVPARVVKSRNDLCRSKVQENHS